MTLIPACNEIPRSVGASLQASVFSAWLATLNYIAVFASSMMDPGWDLREIFIEACVNSDQGRVKCCLQIAGDLLNAKDEHGWSALHYIARHNKTDMLELFLKQPGINVNTINEDDETPLILACIFGHTDIVRTLSRVGGIKFNWTGCFGYDWSALHYSVHKNHYDCVKILLAISAVDVNQKNCDGDSPLSLALANSNVEILKLLLARTDLDLTATDHDGLTVVHQAVSQDSPHAVNCLDLLSKDPRVDWNVKNKYEDTPIMSCVRNKRTEMFRILVGIESVDLDTVDADGFHLDTMAR